MSPKTSKTPQKRDRASLSDINIVFNEQTFEQNQENEHHCETELGNEQTNTETSSKLYKNSDISQNHGTNDVSDEPFHPVTDMDTAAAVQQLFTLTPAVAASQGATPKAKSSAKAAATASTPGMDMDTAAAVQQLFTLTPAVAANQGATLKAKYV